MSDDFINAADNPQVANALVQSVLADTASSAPRIDLPADTSVTLPGGLLTADGAVITDAQVRELTGADEEELARALQGDNAAKVFSTLLDCGVEKIGTEPSSPEVLRRLLVGDREALLLGIRRATYGNEVEIPTWVCPHCGESEELLITLDDIPIRRLEDPKTRLYDVPLRKGGVAQVRLATGADQELLYENAKLSIAARNTLLLSKTVVSLPGPDGETVPVAGTAPVAALGMADRQRILDFMADQMPGPRYDEITYTHEACGKESQISLSIWALFRL